MDPATAAATFRAAMLPSRSWPLTVLTATGWDIRVKGHFFATPLVEVLFTSRAEPALRTSPRWITFAGVAVTIR